MNPVLIIILACLYTMALMIGILDATWQISKFKQKVTIGKIIFFTYYLGFYTIRLLQMEIKNDKI